MCDAPPTCASAVALAWLSLPHYAVLDVFCVLVDYVGICANIPVFQGIGCSSAALTSAFRIDTWAACPPSTSCECELMGINMQSEMTIGVSALEGDEGVLLQNVRDTGRSIEISVICDRSVTSDNLPDPVTDAANHVSMTWRTPLVCAGAEFGWLFLIATGLAAGVYVGGGIGYGKHLVIVTQLMCTYSHSFVRSMQVFTRLCRVCDRTHRLRLLHPLTRTLSYGSSFQTWCMTE